MLALQTLFKVASLGRFYPKSATVQNRFSVSEIATIYSPRFTGGTVQTASKRSCTASLFAQRRSSNKRFKFVRCALWDCVPQPLNLVVMHKEKTVSFIRGINEPKDMLLKLVREGNRVVFEENPTDLLDHFFNFSVTAHSLRDWCLKYKNIQAQKKQMHITWDQNPCLVIAKDVANSVKHFGIDLYTPSLSGSSESFTDYIVFRGDEDIPTKMGKARDDEEFRNSVSQPSPSYLINFNDGTSIDLSEYVFNTINYWVKYFDSHNIPRHLNHDAKRIFANRKIWHILDLEANA
jgi:hypothetical protein